MQEAYINKETCKRVEDSPFGNTYGRLSLYQGLDSGNFYLEMQDCFGPTHYGPLTEKQTKAFHELCSVVENDEI